MTGFSVEGSMRKVFLWAACLLVYCWHVVGLAALCDGENDPEVAKIRHEVRSCETGADNAIQMQECVKQEASKLGTLLDARLATFKSRLSATNLDKLELAQKQWLSYRAKDTEFWQTWFSPPAYTGTYWPAVIVDLQLFVSRQRVIELGCALDPLGAK